MTPRLTLFTTTRPFEGLHAIHQMNSLRAWTSLHPKPQVILLGDDPGAREAAEELAIEFHPEVRRSPGGLPYLSDLFATAQSLAVGTASCYANADIIFPPNISSAIDIVSTRFPRFLIVGQRWDLLIDDPIDLSGPNEWLRLQTRADDLGVLRGPYWIDYFAFSTGMYQELPDLILGRPGWDNWLVWHTREMGVPVIDATHYLTVIHHKHGRSHGPRRTAVPAGSDSAHNRDLIATEAHMFTVGHATHKLTPTGQLVVARGAKYRSARILNSLHPLLRVTRPWRHRLRIEADSVQRLASRFGR